MSLSGNAADMTWRDVDHDDIDDTCDRCGKRGAEEINDGPALTHGVPMSLCEACYDAMVNSD